MARKKEEPKEEVKVVKKKPVKKVEKVEEKTESNIPKINMTYTKYLCFLLFGIAIGLLISIIIKKAQVSNGNVTGDSKYDSLYQTYSTIKDSYYKDIDDEALINGAINGMMKALDDPHSIFFSVEEKDNFETHLSGEYYGVGAEILETTDGEVVIIKVFNDSPAEKAGLKPGDVFVSIDGKEVKGKTATDVATTLRSKEKENATIVVRRDDEEISFEVTKDQITMLSVSSEMLDDNIGYISIDLFGLITHNQFADALEKLEEQGMKKLIIDLRGNGGGYLDSVTRILDNFVDSKTVIYQMKKRDKVEKFYANDDETKDYKVVILVNENSASASEIMASCMKEQYKATLVGKKTYGKGSVQETKELENGTLIKYTTEEWLTSEGNSINGEGIEPDVEVELSEDYMNNPTRENDNQLQKAIEIINE